MKCATKSHNVKWDFVGGFLIGGSFRYFRNQNDCVLFYIKK